MESQSRRQFIKTSFKAAAFITLMDPFRLLMASEMSSEALPSWEELIEKARWCPNVHNLQPHKIKVISSTEAELYYDPTRLLPNGDPKCIFTTVAMGIFIEHLSIAASPYGQKVEIVNVYEPITIQASGFTRFAKLKLAPTTVAENLSADLFTKRRTARGHYNGKPLKTETLLKVSAQAWALGHEFYSTSEKEFIDTIVDLNQKTLFEDLAEDPMKKELHNLFRYNEKDAAATRDGLWSKCMGFSGDLMRSVFTTHKWEKGLRKKVLKEHYLSAFKGTSTICWFGGRFEHTGDWLTAGKMLARNWLILTKDNAYIQPFGSLITNKEAYSRINEKFTQPSENKKIWMVFRAGYCKTPTRSYRLETKEILIK